MLDGAVDILFKKKYVAGGGGGGGRAPCATVCARHMMRGAAAGTLARCTGVARACDGKRAIARHSARACACRVRQFARDRGIVCCARSLHSQCAWVSPECLVCPRDAELLRTNPSFARRAPARPSHEAAAARLRGPRAAVRVPLGRREAHRDLLVRVRPAGGRPRPITAAIATGRRRGRSSRARVSRGLLRERVTASPRHTSGTAPTTRATADEPSRAAWPPVSQAAP